ncbi:FkbM family methyltransferase [Nodosilinea sp. LEGE 06152]|uniref:FkbM family methyltransferase n=1 Tax=Nodosilinea sp. LEGE 06152 TaxID=2777966 RepID=UPI00187E7211|nr:FkbM family methyltransferase [Nodosilinea sp. LEGE 06152]MBE9158410.1 FkbM family methyltransferase [Nodosilinea sp. LEGE 06152]
MGRKLNLKTLLSEFFLSYIQNFPIKRGKYKIATLISHFLDGAVVTSVYGPKLSARFKDSTFWLMARYGNEGCYDHLQDLGANDVFIDIGANIGLFTILASSQCSMVISIEASSREFSELIRNISLNKCTNVVPILGAAGSKLSLSKIHVQEISHSGGNSILLDSISQNICQTQTVQMVTVDHLVNSYKEYYNLMDNNLNNSFVIKIDVEGFEPQVLLGMKAALISGKVRKVIVEIDHQRSKRLANSDFDIYDYMKNCGFIPISNKNENHYDECFVLV